MSEVASATIQPPAHRRQSKFTPANIRQIVNLLERGKTKDEIAEIIGVTPATLQVTCSKLGISLRRPSIDASSRILRSRCQNEGGLHLQELPQVEPLAAAHNEQTKTSKESEPRKKDHTVLRLNSPQAPPRRADQDASTLTVRYGGREKMIDFHLDRSLLGQLALEAVFRSIDIGELIGQVLLSVTEKGLFDLVFEGSLGRSKLHG